MTRASRRKKAYRNKKNPARKTRAVTPTFLLAVSGVTLIAAQPARAQATDFEIVFSGDNWIWVSPDTDHSSWEAIAPGSISTNPYTVLPPNKIHLGEAEGSSSSVTVRNGGMLDIGEFHIAHGLGSTGSMLVSGEGSSVSSNGIPMMVGHYGTGYLQIEDGGRMETGAAQLAGGEGSEGYATVTGPGSQWQVGGDLNVGVYGPASLTVEDGGAVSAAGHVSVGASNSNADVTVTGSNSTLAANQSIVVVTGSLRVEQGATVSSEGGDIGMGEVSANGDPSSGTSAGVTVTGSGSTWTDSERLRVGYGKGSTGTLDVLDGGLVSSSQITIGVYGDGSVRVSGKDSTLTSTERVDVGAYDDGSLLISDGGTVVSGTGFPDFTLEYGNIIGQRATGEVTVTGKDSSWINTGFLNVGYDGTGILRIEDGGTVVNSRGNIGLGTSGVGEVTVTGTDSTWEIHNSSNVGYNGNGTLRIEDGGRVSTTSSMQIGSGATGVGTATVTGATSTLTVGADLVVGYSGNGTLRIEDGGKVSSAIGAVGYENGVGSVTITGPGSEWRLVGTAFWVGVKGTSIGTVRIEDGGALIARYGGYFGLAAGATGSMTVTGPDSRWIVDNGAGIGYLSTGTLRIEEGALASFGTDLTIGQLGGGDGEATVTGSGSRLDVGRTLFIGDHDESRGTLLVEDHAETNTREVVVARDAGSQGSMRVTDATLTTGQISGGDGDATVTFDAATLRLTDDQANLFGGFSPGDVVLASGGAEIDTQSNSVASSAVLSGSGSLTKTGTGTLTLSGANGYTGGTTISAGTLRLGDAGAAGTGTVAVNSPAGAPASTTPGLDLAFASAGSFGNTLAGSGVTEVAAGSALATITGSNTAYAGNWQIAGNAAVAASAATSTANLGSGTVNLASGGSLAATTTGAFSFDNALTGTGTLSASNAGQAFSFGSSAGNAFQGTLSIANDTFALSGANTTALTNATLSVGAGSVTTVGDGTQRIGGLTFDGGTVVFDGTAPEQQIATSLIDTSTLDVSGTGAVRISVPSLYAPPTPTPAGDLSLFQQSHVNGGLELVSAASVTGNASGLTLEDQNGNAISATQNLNVQQSGNVVAVGTYNYALGTGSADNGLYVGYALRQLALQAGQSLTLTENAGATGADADLAAQLTDSGNLVIAANNAVSLSNVNNTFTGTTLVQSGTLRANATNVIASSSAVDVQSTFDTNGYSQSVNNLTGGGSAQVLLSGNDLLTLNNRGTSTYEGTISGAGGVVQASGTQILTGPNTYSGGTTISAGTLQLGNGGTTGSIMGNVVDDGTLAFDRSNNTTFDGTISGSGEVQQIGSGTTTLAGDNSYSGGTTIAGGTLVGSAASFGTGGILDNAALVIDQPADAAFASSLSGTGVFTKAGAGKLDLTGNSAAFGGATTVAAGTLAVNGSLGGTLDVQAGARLQGNGTVGTTTVAGTVAPGNSIGTLNVDGDVTFLPGSVYEVEMTPAQADRLSATGAADLQGGTVRTIKAGGVYLPGSQWTILSAAGGVTGAFDTLDEDLPYVGLALGYDANNVYLDIARNGAAFCLPGFTRNQCATASGVESLGEGHTLYDIVASQASARDAAAAFDQLSGEIHASAKTALIEESRFPRDAAFGRLRSAFGGAGASTAPVMAYGSDGPRPVAPDTRQFAAWGYGFGSWGKTNGDGNAAQLSHDIGGVILGADAPVAGNARVGVLSGYSRSSFDVRDRSSSGNSDNAYLGLFGGAAWGDLALRGGAAYTWHEIDTRRTVAFPGFADSLRSSYSGQTAQVFGELGYEMRAGALALEPYASLAWVNLHMDGYQEKGGLAALSASSQSTDIALSTLGLRASGAFAFRGMDFTARGTLGWRYAFGGTLSTATQSFAGGMPFTVAGVPIARNSAIVEAGLDVAVNASTTLGISCDGVLGSGPQQHGFNLRLNVKF